MDAPLPVNQNPLLEDSILGSNWFNPSYLFNEGFAYLNQFFNFLNTNRAEAISLYHTALFFLAFFFLAIISYTSIRMFEIRRKEHEHLKHEIAEYAHHKAEKEKKSKQQDEVSKNPQWIKTLNYLFSQHGSDWKLAVIEADSMLEGLMTELGFKGETLGEKLKSANQDTFHNLSSAWEVHTIRNKIAHDGASFELSQHEAKRVIALYEQIFRMYGFI